MATKGKEFKVSIESKKMENMFADMQKISAKEFIKFVNFEAGKILQKSAQLTKQAGVKKLNADLASFKQVTNIKGKAWKEKQMQIAEKKRRIGLAKQTWLYLASLVNLNTSGGRGLGRARKATVDNKKIRHDGSARKVSRGKTAYGIEVIYRNPVGAYVGATSALRRAINGRAAYFKKNVENGVFKRAKTIAQKYPGIDITPR